MNSILTYHSNEAEAFDDSVESVKGSLRELGAERFDYLVNNAGTSHHAAFAETTEEDLDASTASTSRRPTSSPKGSCP